VPETKTKEVAEPIVTPDDNTLINELISVMYQDMRKNEGRFKVMELLRALEFKRKIAPPADREGAFWNMIEEIRTQELRPRGPIASVGSETPGTGTEANQTMKHQIMKHQTMKHKTMKRKT